MSDLTCAELVELVTEYLEGSLPAPERERLEAHLGVCDGCTAHIEQLRATLRVAGSLEPEQLSDEAQQRLMAVFRSWASDE